MSKLIISVSGLRGVIGETLTPDIAAAYVAAFAGHLPKGPIIIGRDGRTTGPMIAGAIQSALRACGRIVL
ncbi:MAG: phosphoglucosamine mutase, partial [Planctomycetota bacterium]